MNEKDVLKKLKTFLYSFLTSLIQYMIGVVCTPVVWQVSSTSSPSIAEIDSGGGLVEEINNYNENV